MAEMTVDQWLVASRKEAALKIDPETAEVDWWYAQTLDPYGLRRDLPAENQQVGREYFARGPKSDIWVSFQDLPNHVKDRLWELHRSKFAFPASLFSPVGWGHVA